MRLHILTFSILALQSSMASASEPTIGRLAFWLPPEQHAAFEISYQTEIVPHLERHELRPSSRTARATADSVFSRLFEFDNPTEINSRAKALDNDPAWTATLSRLGIAERTSGAQVTSRYRLRLYETQDTPHVPTGNDRGRGLWRTYEVADGLTPGDIVKIHQDREGYLWFGARDGGVSRFDGEVWTHLSTQCEPPMIQDREGAFWFCTGGNGVRRYETANGAWQSYTTSNGLGHNRVVTLLQDRKGNIWFGALGGGVTRYDGLTWRTFTTNDGLAHDRVTRVIEDRQGRLWIGTDGGGVSVYDPALNLTGSNESGSSAWETYDTGNGLPHNQVGTLYQDRSGNIWVGTLDGAARMDPTDDGWRVFTTDEGLPDGRILRFYEDGQGRIWLAMGGSYGVGGKGLSVIDRNTITTFTTEDGLASNNVLSFAEDNEGHLWIGTYGGISRFDGKRWSTLTTEEGLKGNVVSTVFHDREGHLWFGTQGDGVSQYSGEIRTFTTEDGLVSANVHSVFQDRQDRVWVGTQVGVSRSVPGGWTSYTTQNGLAGNRVHTILQTRNEDLWFTTYRGGVTRYDGKTWSSFREEDGLASDVVWSALEDKDGALWLGTSRGTTRYDPSVTLGEAWTTFTTRDGLGERRIWTIYQDRDDALWFATLGGGLSRFDGESWMTLTKEDGLVNDWVWSVVQDGDGNFWCGTRGGVSRYDGESFVSYTGDTGLGTDDVRDIELDADGNPLFATAGGGIVQFDPGSSTSGTSGKEVGEVVFQSLTRRDGLGNHHVRAIHRTGDGTLWIGTSGGLTRLRRPPAYPPPISIDAVTADRRHIRPTEVTFPSSVNFASFDFHAISFKTQPGAMVYAYRLTGFDDNWKQTRERSVTYQDLPTGTYTFEVTATDRDLVRSNSPATVILTVHLPYERLAWMSGLGIAIILIAWQTIRILQRDRRLQIANAEIQLQTERKSAFLASMSHELRTPMNAIKGFTNMVLRRAGDVLPDRQKENLRKVDQASDHLLAMINDLLDLSKIEAGRMDVNVETFRVDDLIKSACDTVSPLVRDGVELTHEIAVDVGEVHTDKARLQQMVINLLSNAIKFTDAGSVTVTAQRGPGSGNLVPEDPTTASPVSPIHDSRLTTYDLVISVSDTGKGIPPEALPTLFDEYRQVEGQSDSDVQKGTGLGLSITKKFAELLGGSIAVESEVGEGTSFTITMPSTYSA